MSNTLFPGIDTTGEGMVEGEVESFSTDRIVIVGNFTPGDVIQLRPGRRVALLTEDALESELLPANQGLLRQIDELQEDVSDKEREAERNDERAEELQDRIDDAVRTLEGKR